MENLLVVWLFAVVPTTACVQSWTTRAEELVPYAGGMSPRRLGPGLEVKPSPALARSVAAAEPAVQYDPECYTLYKSSAEWNGLDDDAMRRDIPAANISHLVERYGLKPVPRVRRRPAAPGRPALPRKAIVF